LFENVDYFFEKMKPKRSEKFSRQVQECVVRLQKAIVDYFVGLWWYLPVNIPISL
jgi:hypothetical protein